jgi:peptidoglycan/LPS O-acetylase OafA/YrhL
LTGADAIPIRSVVLAAGGRWGAIDVLKAAATLTVVWIHTAHGLARPASVFVYLTTILSSFAVPAFFFAAGFLRWRPFPIRLADLGRWLRRLLVPYLVASVIWIVADAVRTGRAPRPGAIAGSLVFGNALFIYYFVPVLAGALVLTMPMSRWPRLAPPMLLVLGFTGWMCQVGSSSMRVGIFWTIRDPRRWWGFFVAGWCVAVWLHRSQPSVHLCRTVGVVVLAVVAMLAVVAAFRLHSLPPSAWTWPPDGTITYMVTYVLIVGILGAAMGLAHPATRFIAAVSYPVYLYHPAFVEIARAVVPGSGLAGSGAVFALACAGSLAAVWVVRRSLGRWSALILGTASA